MTIDVDQDGRVADLGFTGHRCAASQASGSLACHEVKGMEVDGVRRLDRDFILELPRLRALRHAPEMRPAVAQGCKSAALGAEVDWEIRPSE